MTRNLLRMTMMRPLLPLVFLTVDKAAGVSVLGQELLSSVLDKFE